MSRRRGDPSLDRRTLLKTMGAAALLGTAAKGEAAATAAGAAVAAGPTYPVTFRGMPGDGPGRPRICLGAPASADEGQLRRLKQRLIDMDREYGKFQNQYPGGGGFAGEIYNVGYTRAMLQAALTL